MPGGHAALLFAPLFAVLATLYMQAGQFPLGSLFSRAFVARLSSPLVKSTRSSVAWARRQVHSSTAAAAAGAAMPAPGAASVRHIPAEKLTVSKPTWW